MESAFALGSVLTLMLLGCSCFLLLAGYFINSIDWNKDAEFVPIMSIFGLRRWAQTQLEDKSAASDLEKTVAESLEATLLLNRSGTHRDFEHFHAHWERMIRLLRQTPCSIREIYRLPTTGSEVGSAPATASSAVKRHPRYVWAIDKLPDMSIIGHTRTEYKSNAHDLSHLPPDIPLSESDPPTVWVGRSNAFALDVAVFQPPTQIQITSAAAATSAAGAAGASAVVTDSKTTNQQPPTFVGIQLKWSAPSNLAVSKGDNKIGSTKQQKKQTTDAEMIGDWNKWTQVQPKIAKEYGTCFD